MLLGLLFSSRNVDSVILSFGGHRQIISFTAVQRLEGCPFIICTDPGTETVTIRDCHRYLLRDLDPDGAFVYMSGSSTANQRIK